MKQNEIHVKKRELAIERNKLNEQLRANTNNLLNLQKKCPHTLVLKFNDHKLHKIGQIYNYFCPACGKWANIYQTHEFEETFFKNTIIIDLTMYPEYIFNDYISSICNNIFDNYDYYYDNQIDEKEKVYSIIKFIDGQKTYKKQK